MQTQIGMLAAVVICEDIWKTRAMVTSNNSK